MSSIQKTMCKIFRLFALMIAVALVGCGATLPKVKPYKMDIQQGNVVTSKMLLKLRPGMTKSQVKFILGTPLLVDSFHTNRWDYFYQLRKQGKIINQRRVILDFENDSLKRVRGDVVPKEATAEDVTRQLETEAMSEDDAEKPVASDIDTARPAAIAPDTSDAESIEVPAASTETNLSPMEDAAEENDEPVSVLAVPIPVVPTTEVPEIVPEVEKTTEEVEALKESADVKMEALKDDVPAIEPASTVAPSQEEMQIKASVDAQPTNARPYNERVFILDRQLDTTRIKQNATAEQVAPADDRAIEDSVVKEIEKGQDQNPSNQEEPSFF